MITRRDFIRISCLFPLALTLDARDIPRFTEEIREKLMGTFVQIKAVGARPGLLYNTVQYMRMFEAMFSRFDRESNLSILNQEGAVRRPKAEFVELMEAAGRAHGETNGVFDPTVLPVLLHFERCRRALTDGEREKYRERTGFSKVAVYRDVVYVTDKKMRLTLDGIATGYIVDRGVEFLHASGCVETLVNVGGDISCGRRPEGWEVGVYNPVTDSLSRKLSLETKSICTSGSYVNYYTVDRLLHHLIDPVKLTCPADFVSATVVSGTTTRADMLSTTLFLAGVEGKKLLRPGERAYLIARDGREIVL